MRTLELYNNQYPSTLIQGDQFLTDEPVMLKQEGQPVAVIIPFVEYQAFRAWQEVDLASLPSAPAPTAEGDKEALAAVERIGAMFPPLDAETAQYIAESPEISLDYHFSLDDE